MNIYRNIKLSGSYMISKLRNLLIILNYRFADRNKHLSTNPFLWMLSVFSSFWFGQEKLGSYMILWKNAFGNRKNLTRDIKTHGLNAARYL